MRPEVVLKKPMNRVTMDVTVTVTRGCRIRLWLGLWLIRLGVRTLGAHFGSVHFVKDDEGGSGGE